MPTYSPQVQRASMRCSGHCTGGANQAVLEMLQQIHDSDEGVDKFIERVKNREDGVKLMGFGHRHLQNYDPRAKIIKNATDDVLGSLER